MVRNQSHIRNYYHIQNNYLWYKSIGQLRHWKGFFPFTAGKHFHWKDKGFPRNLYLTRQMFPQTRQWWRWFRKITPYVFIDDKYLKTQYRISDHSVWQRSKFAIIGNYLPSIHQFIHILHRNSGFFRTDAMMHSSAVIYTGEHGYLENYHQHVSWFNVSKKYWKRSFNTVNNSIILYTWNFMKSSYNAALETQYLPTNPDIKVSLDNLKELGIVEYPVSSFFGTAYLLTNVEEELNTNKLSYLVDIVDKLPFKNAIEMSIVLYKVYIIMILYQIYK